MRLAVITDTHYGARKGSKLFHDYFEKFYNDIFFPALDDNKIKTVIDHWKFTRKMTSSSPNWYLAEVKNS